MNKKGQVEAWIFIVILLAFFFTMVYLTIRPDLTYDRNCLEEYANKYCKEIEYFDSKLSNSYQTFDCIRPLNEDLRRTNNEINYINFLDKELKDCKKGG